MDERGALKRQALIDLIAVTARRFPFGSDFETGCAAIADAVLASLLAPTGEAGTASHDLLPLGPSEHSKRCGCRNDTHAVEWTNWKLVQAEATLAAAVAALRETP